MSTPATSVLHVYSPESYHDDAYLLGTPAALTALHAAIGQLLDNPTPGRTVFVQSFTADGEGFELVVGLESETTMDATALPYTSEICTDPESRAAENPDWPWITSRTPKEE